MRIALTLTLLFILFLSACASDSDSTEPSGEARLLNVQFSHGPLDQHFYDGLSDYSGQVGFLVTSTRLSVEAIDGSATVAVNGSNAIEGRFSEVFALVEGENTINIKVTAEDGITTRDYRFVITREAQAAFAQKAYVKASNTDASDSFSYNSVALDGDTLVVGSWAEDSSATGIGGDQTENGAPNAGAVYVFTREAGAWTQQAYIKASNTGEQDFFGRSLALDGDTLVVSAENEDSNATGVGYDTGSGFDHGTDTGDYDDSGAVYVYFRSGGVWSQQAYIKATNTGEFDSFGKALALDGNTLAIGADGEKSSASGIGGDQADNSASQAGAVYVFTRDGGAWTQQAYIKASNTDPGDYFGIELALDDNTLLVSAQGEASSATGVGGDETNNDANFSGAVYVFTRASGTWSQQAYVKASNAGATDSFGWSLALDGDTMAVGAPEESSSATGVGGDESNNDASFSGAVYVFTRNTVVWSQQAYLKASNTDEDDGFGYSVALEGNTLVVGAYGEDSSSSGFGGTQSNAMSSLTYDAGAVYLFTRSAESWDEHVYMKASNADSGDWFGFRVALDGGLLAVGSTREDGGSTGVGGDQSDNLVENSGAVYLFE